MGAACRRFVFPFLLVGSCIGCGGRAPDEAADVQVKLAIQPDPPQVGLATAIVQLTDEKGTVLKGASLKLEGNMNHAGMKPVFADAKEVDDGKYEASLDLTMGGDWFVLITGTLADGRKLRRKVDIPAVKSRGR